jgi:hypothetical protein
LRVRSTAIRPAPETAGRVSPSCSDLLSCHKLEVLVLLSVIAVAAAGVLVGLRFKAPALIATTAVLLAGSLVWNGLGFPGHVTISRFLILVFALACAYVVGLLLSTRGRRP